MTWTDTRLRACSPSESAGRRQTMRIRLSPQGSADLWGPTCSTLIVPSSFFRKIPLDAHVVRAADMIGQVAHMKNPAGRERGPRRKNTAPANVIAAGAAV